MLLPLIFSGHGEKLGDTVEAIMERTSRGGYNKSPYGRKTVRTFFALFYLIFLLILLLIYFNIRLG